MGLNGEYSVLHNEKGKVCGTEESSNNGKYIRRFLIYI